MQDDPVAWILIALAVGIALTISIELLMDGVKRRRRPRREYVARPHTSEWITPEEERSFWQWTNDGDASGEIDGR